MNKVNIAIGLLNLLIAGINIFYWPNPLNCFASGLCLGVGLCMLVKYLPTN